MVGGGILTLGRRSELPMAPVEIADAVEMFAREWGRHATLMFIPTVLVGRQLNKAIAGTWCAKFTLKTGDKRMRLNQMQVVETPVTEDVWFHVPRRGAKEGELEYIPLDIHQMGVSGVRQFLEKGNTWSGRGEFSSLEEQYRLSSEKNLQMRGKNKEDQKEAARLEARDRRRSLFKIPFHTVGIDLKKKKKKE